MRAPLAAPGHEARKPPRRARGPAVRRDDDIEKPNDIPALPRRGPKPAGSSSMSGWRSRPPGGCARRSRSELGMIGLVAAVGGGPASSEPDFGFGSIVTAGSTPTRVFRLGERRRQQWVGSASKPRASSARVDVGGLNPGQAEGWAAAYRELRGRSGRWRRHRGRARGRRRSGVRAPSNTSCEKRTIQPSDLRPYSERRPGITSF